MSRKTQTATPVFELRMSGEVARQIRQHARSCLQSEVCGVLIGSEEGGCTHVEASIAGADAEQGGSHVTFTQDTWEHIYRIKDRDYPEARIVGWYHSHPGFGVFLSDHDSFIHQNFFSSPRQVAWVYDPHSDEEGCFGWIEGSLQRLKSLQMQDDKGGERAGETGKPEPAPGLLNEELREVAAPEKKRMATVIVDVTFALLTYIAFFLVGGFVSWIFFPRAVPVFIDPRTGNAYIVGSQTGAGSMQTPPAAPQNAPAGSQPSSTKGKP